MESLRELNLSLLSTFVQAVSTGSFRDAADERGLAASTVQKHMRSLEQQLDLVLFERNGRTIRPTRVAHALALAAAPLLKEGQLLQTRIHELRASTDHIVRLACSPIHLAHFLGPVL